MSFYWVPRQPFLWDIIFTVSNNPGDRPWNSLASEFLYKAHDPSENQPWESAGTWGLYRTFLILNNLKHHICSSVPSVPFLTLDSTSPSSEIPILTPISLPMLCVQSRTFLGSICPYPIHSLIILEALLQLSNTLFQNLSQKSLHSEN